VVHRDVKPDNIFLERRPEAGLRSRLIDFGVARIHGLEQVSGREDHLVGTPRYMAPEVVDGGPAEGPADLYALGVCLYERLVGRAPFVGRSALDILWQHLDRAPRPPSSAVAHLPAIVDAVVLALLEKDPRDRPSTAAEAWDVLERI
jgi:serine/threonine-protein kinase